MADLEIDIICSRCGRRLEAIPSFLGETVTMKVNPHCKCRIETAETTQVERDATLGKDVVIKLYKTTKKRINK